MIERASIRFYNIKQCGLFKPRARSCTMGNFNEVANNISNWAALPKRLINNTCTYEVNENFDQEFLETYLVYCHKEAASGDFMLCFWNRTHASGDSVYALDAGAQLSDVTEHTFHQGKLPESSIPGYATYFWLIPSKSAMATITFGSPRSGMNAFSYWLESFYRTESRYAEFDKKNQFIGYRAVDGSIYKDLEPRFTKQLYSNPSKRDLIESNRQHIKGLIRRINLNRADVDDNNMLEKLKNYVGITSDTKLLEHEVSLKYEFTYTPSEKELAQIFFDYESSVTKSNWEDVGFVFPENNNFGANKTEWLSKSFAKIKIPLDIDWVLAGQLINGTTLLNSIRLQRAELLSLLYAKPAQILNKTA